MAGQPLVRARITGLALSTASLLVGAAIAGFALLTNYLVMFAPPPHCDMLCPLLALAPTVTAVLWSLWLIAWCIPAWRRLGYPKRWLSIGVLAVSLASFLMLYSSFQ